MASYCLFTGPKSAIFSANTGISEVGFIKDTNSVTFIETTPAGNKHVMIIEDIVGCKRRWLQVHIYPIFKFGEKYEICLYRNCETDYTLQDFKKPYQINPSLKGTKIFTIFAQEGNFKTFNIESGKLLENGKAKDFRNGEIMFMITGTNSAIMSGNAGSAKVELVKDDDFVTFIETTSGGNKHIMIIANEWDVKEKGFKFTYIRNTDMSPLLPKLVRTIYNGIAKPKAY